MYWYMVFMKRFSLSKMIGPKIEMMKLMVIVFFFFKLSSELIYKINPCRLSICLTLLLF